MMEQKINIAELLKDCPTGMELDCAMYEDVHFDYVDGLNNIRCYIQQKFNKTSVVFHQDGTPNSHIKSKCVIFPKGKTTWEGFVPPCEFKDGDIVYVKTINHHEYILIFKEIKNDHIHKYVCFSYQRLSIDKCPVCLLSAAVIIRLATEEEKQKLFDAIKSHGYKWDANTKTLEELIKPKFKVDDKIKLKGGDEIGIILQAADYFYIIKSKNNIQCWSIEEQDDWELVPNKFDVINFEPFMKVLVRSDNSDVWECDFFSSYNPKCSNRFHCIGAWYNICIPYIGNEHLRGTTDDCDDFYKL